MYVYVIYNKHVLYNLVYMKKKNKIILTASISSSIAVAGIVMFTVCGLPTYELTDQMFGRTKKTYGIGWLNYTNQSIYMNVFPPNFFDFLSAFNSENKSIAQDNLQAAHYWLSMAKNEDETIKYTEMINFYSTFLNTLNMFVISFAGLAMMLIFILISCCFFEKLYRLNKKDKVQKEEPELKDDFDAIFDPI